MKPTVGRIVHYVSYGTPNGEFQPEHRAAVITKVNYLYPFPDPDAKEVHSVSLFVMNPNGVFLNEVVYQDEDRKMGGTWHWPERDEE